MAHGGKRPNSGRKPKADEIKLIESMDAVLAPQDVWVRLSKLVKDNDIQAIKTWLSYRYGQPKQMVDVTSGGEKIQQQFTVMYPSDADELNKI